MATPPKRDTVEKRRYRKVSTRMYFDDKFLRLSSMKPSGQGLWLYLITGPHTNAVPGLFVAGEAQLAEALQWKLTDFRRCWKEIADLRMAEADWKVRLVWLPKAIRHNIPESPNVVTGWKVHLDELPACQLRDRALRDIMGVLGSVGNSGAHAKAFAEVLPEDFRKALPKDSGDRGGEASEDLSLNQEQEQEDPPNPLRGLLVDEPLDERARTFFERYPQVYAKVRKGAIYRPKEARDFPTVIELVSLYPDVDRLCLMAEVFLKRGDIGPKNIPGTIGQFAHMAPDCDAQLRAHGQ